MEINEYQKPRLEVTSIDAAEGFLSVIVTSTPLIDDDDTADEFP